MIYASSTCCCFYVIPARPEWVRRPEDVRSAEEENAEFFCEAGGSPPPKIQWTINGRPVEGGFQVV